MNIMKEFQKTMGTQGIGVSYKDDTGIWNKYFLFSEIKKAEKYFNEMKKQYGDAVSVHFNKVVY